MLALVEPDAENEQRQEKHGEHEPALGVAPAGAAPPRARRSRRFAARHLPGTCARRRAGRRGEAAQRHRHRGIMDPAQGRAGQLLQRMLEIYYCCTFSIKKSYAAWRQLHTRDSNEPSLCASWAPEYRRDKKLELPMPVSADVGTQGSRELFSSTAALAIHVMVLASSLACRESAHPMCRCMPPLMCECPFCCALPGLRLGFICAICNSSQQVLSRLRLVQDFARSVPWALRAPFLVPTKSTKCSKTRCRPRSTLLVWLLFFLLLDNELQAPSNVASVVQCKGFNGAKQIGTYRSSFIQSMVGFCQIPKSDLLNGSIWKKVGFTAEPISIRF